MEIREKTLSGLTYHQVCTALDCDPPKNWVAEHQRNEYVPIQKMIIELDKLFGKGGYQFKNLVFKQVVNELVCSVDVVLLFPSAGWITYAGISSAPILQNAGTSVADFASQKKKATLNKDSGAAKSKAIANALRIFNLFGFELNESQTVQKARIKDAKDNVGAKIAACKTLKELKAVIMTEKEKKAAKRILLSHLEDFARTAKEVQSLKDIYAYGLEVSGESKPPALYRAVVERQKELSKVKV
jgi:hypothetical protein